MSFHVVSVDFRFNRFFNRFRWQKSVIGGWDRFRYNSVSFILDDCELHLLDHSLHKTRVTLRCHHTFNVHNVVILRAVAHDRHLFKSDPTLLIFKALTRHLSYEIISFLSQFVKHVLSTVVYRGVILRGAVLREKFTLPQRIIVYLWDVSVCVGESLQVVVIHH